MLIKLTFCTYLLQNILYYVKFLSTKAIYKLHGQHNNGIWNRPIWSWSLPAYH